MTIEEVNTRYGVPLEVLKAYESWELCGRGKKVTDAWEYDNQDIEQLSMIMTLRDVGFDNNAMELYMKLFLKGSSTGAQRLAMLNRKRTEILDEVHSREAKISRLDYLRYKIQTVQGKAKAVKR